MTYSIATNPVLVLCIETETHRLLARRAIPPAACVASRGAFTAWLFGQVAAILDSKARDEFVVSVTWTLYGIPFAFARIVESFLPFDHGAAGKVLSHFEFSPWQTIDQTEGGNSNGRTN